MHIWFRANGVIAREKEKIDVTLLLLAPIRRWYVSWGEGASSYQHFGALGPFQATHQYADAPGSYAVTDQYSTAALLPLASDAAMKSIARSVLPINWW